MTVPETIEIRDGTRGKVTYYYWSEYDGYEEALYYAKKIRKEREKEFRIRWFILNVKEGRFLPIPKFILYLNKKLRI